MKPKVEHRFCFDDYLTTVYFGKEETVVHGRAPEIKKLVDRVYKLGKQDGAKAKNKKLQEHYQSLLGNG